MTIRYKRPDAKDALSLVQAAKRQMDFTLTMKPTDDSAFTIVRNIYECFRMLGDALLVKKGVESDDHLAPINELLKLKVNTVRPIFLIDNLRRLRHNVNYYGYSPKKAEADDAISIAKSCFNQLYAAALREVEK
ncbi:MAG: hypothetical protein PHO02_02675 [Candidatus Nanoarchaeia archaeon]|nr:hypothetical protein [Candidatus Nanoarchaeia archaeon]